MFLKTFRGNCLARHWYRWFTNSVHEGRRSLSLLKLNAFEPFEPGEVGDFPSVGSSFVL